MIEITERASDALQAAMARTKGQAAGVRITASKDSAALLMGCLLDYGETDNGLAFTFFNPNALIAEASPPTHGCSCGKNTCSSA